MTITTLWGSIATAALMMTASAANATNPAVAPAPAPIASPAAGNLSQRYCIIDDATTGSRIRQRQCASLAEWQVRGVDPRKMRRVSGWRTAGDQ